MMDGSLPSVLCRTPLALAAATLLWSGSALAAGPSAEGSASISTSGANARTSSSGAAGRGKRFRLHADTEFFGFTHFDDEGPGPDTDINAVGFGIGRPTLIDSSACTSGFLIGGCILSARPMWGLGFGYAFSQQRAVIGGRFSFVVDGVFTDDDVDDSTTLVSGQFVPYFRWIFLPGRAFRPYIEGRFGLGGGAVVYDNDEVDAKRTTNVIWPTVGFGGGLHIFIIDAFSLDLGLNFDYLAPHSRTESDPPDPMDDEDYDQVANVFNLAALAGFSVWFD